MIVKLTKRELDAIEKRIEESERRLEEARERARSLRPEAPEPAFFGVKDEDKLKVFEEWLKTGSDEWRKAYNEAQALSFERFGKNDARAQALQDADDKLLKKITKSQEETVKELKKQVVVFLQTDFIYKEKKDGRFEPASCIKAMLEDLFFKPMQTLDADKRLEIETFIDARIKELPTQMLSYSPKYSVSYGISRGIKGTDSGQRAGVENGKEIVIPCSYTIYYLIPAVKDSESEIEKKRYYIASTPKNYITTVDRVSKSVFGNKLTRPVDAKSNALWDVPLESRCSKRSVTARCAIGYDKAIQSGIFKNLPNLTEDDYDVHDAIISHLEAGIYAFTKLMLYRVMSGKIQGNLELSEDINRVIEEALLKFRGEIDLVYSETDKDGNTRALNLHRQIVTYQRGEAYLNGKYVEDVIIVPRDEAFMPPLLEWARFNRNEIDTRDVTLLDVKGLYNGKESRAIKRCLYRRLIEMENKFKRTYNSRRELPDNQRSIRFDYVYKKIGLDEPNVDKRKLVKDKIDHCMKYWKDKGLITDYCYKKDKSAGNAFYAVEVSFMPVGAAKG